MKTSTLDMTKGPVLKQLIIFSVPILFGELFQQLYNTIDSAIVGTWVGPEALAAVGATGNITRILVGFFSGLSLGCTVMIARLFGAKELEQLKDSISIILFLSLILGIFLSALGVIITPWSLKLLKTPDDIRPLASEYLTIYFYGLTGLVLYNSATGILRAVGDSRHPLYFLIFSSVLNVILDVIFVVFFHAGVAGVAYATILSQLIAAIFCLLLLARTKECYRWNPRGPKYKKDVVREICRIGFPTAIQKSLTQFSNVIVLSYISIFGSSCLAGWAVYTKLYNFMITAAQSISSSATTFVSQNLGAKNYSRIPAGVRTSFLCSIIATLGFAACFSLTIPQVSLLFGNSPEMNAYARYFVYGLVWFQPLHCFMSCYAGALRGLGHARSATCFMLFGLIGCRQLYLSLITKCINTPLIVGYAYPLGWIIGGICLYAAYRMALRKL